MPYAKRICDNDDCGASFVPRARADAFCGPCRSGRGPQPTALVPPRPDAKILFFDIETMGVNALKGDLGLMVNFGYKWKGGETKVLTARHRDLRHFDDRWLLTQASREFEKADLVVGHFASVFDRRFFQARLAVNKLPSIPPTRMRDTCMIARSAFNFSSNRLEHLANLLDLPVKKYKKKAGTEWPGWWFGVMRGDMTSLRSMAKYCGIDVDTVEALYYRLLPFDNAHPRIFKDKLKCGACGSAIQYRGLVWANGRQYRRYRCTGCGRWGRDTGVAK